MVRRREDCEWAAATPKSRPTDVFQSTGSKTSSVEPKMEAAGIEPANGSDRGAKRPRGRRRLDGPGDWTSLEPTEPDRAAHGRAPTGRSTVRGAGTAIPR
jgi:hypothetical protein